MRKFPYRRFGAFVLVILMLVPANLGLAGGATVLRVQLAGSDMLTSWSMDDLHDLPVIVIETTTPFTDGRQRFAGVALHAVLGEVEPNAVLLLRALNDYVVSIPVAEITEQVPIIAYERNGTRMSVRDKGPLWVIYPFDDGPDYQNELSYSRSIWQLVEITVAR